MFLWLIILAGALGAGVVVLHGFNCWTGNGAQMLDTYQHLLSTANRKRQQAENDKPPR
jgi:hypothetical protein